MPLARTASPSHTGRSNTQSTEPDYSNEDIAILHDVVVLAQHLLPSLPERERHPTFALFTAYYDILPRQGVNIDVDQRLARVIFKIGGLRGTGSLFEKFEDVLSRMGIDIEFSGGDDTYDSIDGALLRNDQLLHASPVRRNSESSRWDLGFAATPSRRNSLSGILKHKRKDGETPEFIRELRREASSHNNEAGATFDEERSDVIELPKKTGRERQRSFSTQGSMHVRRNIELTAQNRSGPTRTSHHTSEENRRASVGTAATSWGGENDTHESVKSLKRFAFNQPSPSLLDIKASLIRQRSLGTLSKQILEIWKERTIQRREDNRNLETIAINHDEKTLLRGALGDWRAQVQTKHILAERQRLYHDLEAQAMKARDLQVSRQIFTHWRASAAEEVERMALARRHLIRTKIFHTWVDLSVRNNSKIRIFILKKFIGKWRTAIAVSVERNSSVVQNYQGSLTGRAYRAWLQEHWMVRAVVWWSEVAKRKAFSNWDTALHQRWEDERTAEHKQRDRLVRRTLCIWKAKLAEHAQQGDRAEFVYKAKLRTLPFKLWRLETRAMPAIEAIQENNKVRHIRDYFKTWRIRTQQEGQATQVDRTKILQEGLTAWQNKVRSKLVNDRIHKRLLVESLYKLALAQRAFEVERKVAEQETRRVLHLWIESASQSKLRRLEQEEEARVLLAQKSLRSTLEVLQSRLKHQRQLSDTAAEFHTPRVLQLKFEKWGVKSQHQKKLEQWGKDASFYFLASKTIKRWKSLTEATKREKRKQAYIQLRRICKVNLLKSILGTWSRGADERVELHRRAAEIYHNKTVVIGMNLLDRWHGRLEDVYELQATSQEVQLRKHINAWRQRSATLEELEVEADNNYIEKRQSRSLKKWNLKTLQIRAQSNYALEIQEKNGKRNFRRIFGYWLQKAAQIRPYQKPDEDIPEDTESLSESGEEGDGPELFGRTIPGYLQTPSKRVERVRSLATRLSTTPRIPISTPFERQLRAQYSGGQLPSFRKSYGRSILGKGTAFEDIVERDTSNDNL